MTRFIFFLFQWLEFDPSLAYCRADGLQNLAQDGYTLMHVAAKYNNIEAMKVLLEMKHVSSWAVDLQGRLEHNSYSFIVSHFSKTISLTLTPAIKP